jgi:hypothetical protein
MPLEPPLLSPLEPPAATPPVLAIPPLLMLAAPPLWGSGEVPPVLDPPMLNPPLLTPAVDCVPPWGAIAPPAAELAPPVAAPPVPPAESFGSGSSAPHAQSADTERVRQQTISRPLTEDVEADKLTSLPSQLHPRRGPGGSIPIAPPLLSGEAGYCKTKFNAARASGSRGLDAIRTA